MIIPRILLLFCLVPSFLIAQPVLQLKDAMMEQGSAIYSVYTQQGSSNSGYAGAPGSNQTWDFSSVQFTDTATYQFQIPSDTNFATATHQKGDRMFEENSGYLNWLGVRSGGFPETYDTALKYLKLPITYGDNFIDTSQGVSPSFLRFVSIDSRVDGYGTVITKDSTFSNCLRVQSIYVTRYIDATIRDTIYSYYAANLRTHLVQVNHKKITSIVSPTSYSARIEVYNPVLSPTPPNPLGIITRSGLNDSFWLYHDTHREKLVLQFKRATKGEVCLYNISGEKVESIEPFEVSVVEMNTSELKSGVYFISVESGESQQFKKVYIH